MEDYMRETEAQLLQRYRDFVQELDTVKISPVNEKNWRAFLVDYLFKIESSNAAKPTVLISYLGATNRGVLAFSC